MQRLRAIAALCLPLMAQAQVYKCGSTYQAQPCDGGRKLDITAATKPDTARAARICQAILEMRLKDPESARYRSEWLPLGPQKHDGQATVAWGRSVNAKNEMGGYTGDRSVICHLSADYQFVGMTGG